MDVPWRRDFDAARDPYTGRNALGITGALVYEAPQDGTAYERKDGAWVPASGGGGGISDAPSDGTLYGRLNAAWSAAQPLDGDLTSLAAASSVAIYYRSAANTWGPVTIGSGLSFSGGTLSCTVSTSGFAPLASPVFTGDPQAPTPATADNDTSVATTAFVKAQGYITSSAVAAGYQPLDADLTAIAGLAGVQGDIIYRDGSAWNRLAAGTSGQFLKTLGSGANPQWATPTGGGDVTQAGNNTFTGQNYFNLGANLPLVVGHTAATDTTLVVETSGGRMANTNWATSATLAGLNLRKSRGGGTPGTHGLVASGDGAQINFQASDGSAFIGFANISGAVDGTPSAGVMPGRISFNARGITGGSVEQARVSAVAGATTYLNLSGGVGQGLIQTGGAGGAVNIINANLSGSPIATTPAAGDNSTAVATTAWVQGAFPTGAWTAWTPTISSSGGTITSSSVNIARYTKAGKTITAYFDVSIVTAGTGTGFLNISLPVTASASGGGAAFGREVNTTASAIAGTIGISATVVGLARYDGATLVVSGYRVIGTIVYEST